MSSIRTSVSNGPSESLDELANGAWKVSDYCHRIRKCSKVLQIYRTLIHAPEEVGTVCDGTLALFGALRLVDEQVRGGQLSALDKKALRDHITRSQVILSGLEEALQNLRAQREGLDSVSNFGPKLSLIASRIVSFHEVLQRYEFHRSFK